MSDTKRKAIFFSFNLTATLILFVLLAAPQVFTHGGEDHGNAKPAVASNQKGIIARTARAGEFEVLLKYSVLEPDTDAAAKLFITRFATNEPFADVKPTIEITAKDGRTFEASEVNTDAPGSYSFKFPPLPRGAYTVLAKLNVAGEIDTATFSNVSVEYSGAAASPTDSGSRLRTALMILTAAVILGLFGGLMFYVFSGFARGERVSEKAVSV